MTIDYGPRIFRRRVAAALFMIATLAHLSACRSTVSRIEARGQADDLLGILLSWAGPLEVEPDLVEFQSRLQRSVLTPSGVFRDENGWTTRAEAERLLEVQGRATSQGYRLNRGADHRPSRRPGEYRSTLSLERLSENEYEWRWFDEMALGAVPVHIFSRILETVLRDAESSQSDLKAKWREAMPRSARVLGRHYAIEKLDTEHLPDGTAAITLEAIMTPDGLESDFPNYARYLKKFVGSIEMDMAAFDLSGTPLWSFTFEDLNLSLRLRVQDGRLVSLEGHARPLPDELCVKYGYSAKAGLFRVGFRNLVMDITMLRGTNEKGFIAVARASPDWRVPFFLDPFVKGALERPFEGEGTVMRVTVEGAREQPTRVKSGLRMAVKETWLMRRMGGLDGSQLEAKAEEDIRRYERQVLQAVHDDVVALLNANH